jgi:tetratricopeptide (TPR) repeat protein
LAEKYDANRETSRALAELSAVASSNSNALQVHYNAGLLYLKLAKRDAAVQEFERELVLNPHDTLSRYPLGDILLGGSNTERGISLMREVIQARPDDAEARLSLGGALLKKGQIAEAIENLELASRLEPEGFEIRYQLGQAYIAGGRKAEGKTQIELSKQLRSRSQPTSNDK